MMLRLAFLSLALMAPLMAAAQLKPQIMTPRDLLFEPTTKDNFMAHTKEERVESIGRVLELTNREKQLPVKTISERAYKIEECVGKNIGEKRYKDKDAMTVISDCVVTLNYD